MLPAQWGKMGEGAGKDKEKKEDLIPKFTNRDENTGNGEKERGEQAHKCIDTAPNWKKVVEVGWKLVSSFFSLKLQNCSF